MGIYFLSNLQGTRSLKRRSSQTALSFLEASTVGSWALTSLLPYSAVLCSAFQRQKPVLPVMWLGLQAPENGSLEGLW